MSVIEPGPVTTNIVPNMQANGTVGNFTEVDSDSDKYTLQLMKTFREFLGKIAPVRT